MSDYKQPIPAGNTAPQESPDSTKTGDKFIYENTSSANVSAGKISGTAANEVVNFQAIALDKDQVIQTGGGSDTFRFSTAEAVKNANVNAIIKFDSGSGSSSSSNTVDNDTVILNGRQEDYVFTLRGDNGIKIQYVNGDFHGAAVTFYGADTFVFRQIGTTLTEQENGSFTTVNSSDSVNETYTFQQLTDLLV